MTTKTDTMESFEKKVPTRRIVMGIIFLLAGILIWYLFVQNVEPGIETTFKMVPGGSDQEISDLVFTTLPMLKILSGVSIPIFFIPREDVVLDGAADESLSICNHPLCSAAGTRHGISRTHHIYQPVNVRGRRDHRQELRL